MIAVLIIDYSNMQDTPFIKLPVELDALLRTSLYLNIVHETFKVSGRQFNVCDNRLLLGVALQLTQGSYIGIIT